MCRRPRMHFAYSNAPVMHSGTGGLVMPLCDHANADAEAANDCLSREPDSLAHGPLIDAKAVRYVLPDRITSPLRRGIICRTVHDGSKVIVLGVVCKHASQKKMRSFLLVGTKFRSYFH
ncbi:hypothetical protein BURKHO8Y_30079 [Burkholderia sp. 8Y]|nr:hypothetical protein BURKHO8Y_30079 [Burkholderia sp. 8Y]